MRIEAVDDLAAFVGKFDLKAVEAARHFTDRRGEIEHQLLLAELAHQRRFFLNKDELALADDADPIGHLFGLFDIVRGEDDGDAVLAQPAHHLPHVAPQLDIDAGAGLIEEEDFRLVAERLRDHDAALHAAGKFHDLGVALFPQRKIAQHFFDVGRVRLEAEQPTAEVHGVDHALERVRVQLLRHEADLFARLFIIGDDVIAVGDDRACREVHDPAGHVDERRLAGAVRTQKREDFALHDVER